MFSSLTFLAQQQLDQDLLQMRTAWDANLQCTILLWRRIRQGVLSIPRSRGQASAS